VNSPPCQHDEQKDPWDDAQQVLQHSNGMERKWDLDMHQEPSGDKWQKIQLKLAYKKKK
jgi:hypothetical protein